jgi:hypothetical protein
VSYSLSVRQIEEEQFDGSTGSKIDSITTYQLGAEIDGVFVPFVTKSGGYIDSQVERGKALQAQTSTSEPATGSSGDGGTTPPAGTDG